MDRCTHEILSTTNDNLLQQTTLHKPDAEVVVAIQLNRGQGAVSWRLLAVLGYDKYHIGDAVYYLKVEYHIRIPLHLFDHTCFKLFSRCEVEVYISTKCNIDHGHLLPCAIFISSVDGPRCMHELSS